ncbi:integrase [Rhizobium pisi]
MTTAYAAGLRASEAVHRKVRDIDGEPGIIRVEQGSSGKGANVMMSAQLLAMPRVLAAGETRGLAVSGPGRDQAHRRPGSVFLYSACRSACTAAGIDKRVTGYIRCVTALPPIFWKA